jgi:hypothetical protein
MNQEKELTNSIFSLQYDQLSPQSSNQSIPISHHMQPLHPQALRKDQKRKKEKDLVKTEDW